MPLEDLTGPDKYLDALNTDWPLNDDDRPEGDDHIRGIKNVLVNQFGAQSQKTDPSLAMYWNDPQEGDVNPRGAAAMASGTTAQRPTSPSLYAWRWNTDADPDGHFLEMWNGAEWCKCVPALETANHYEGDASYQCGNAAGLWADVRGISWQENEAATDKAAELKAKWLTDPTPGPGEAEVQLQAYIAGALQTVLSLTAAGADFQNIGAVLLGGKPLMTVDPNYDSGATAFSAGSVVSFTHGLGRKPTLWRVMLECTALDAGHAVGDLVDFGTVCGTNDTTNNGEAAISSAYQDNDTEIKVRISNKHIALPSATGVYTKINMASWALRCLAW